MRIGVTVMSLWGTNKLVPIQSNGNIGNIGYQICLANPYFQLTAILTPGLDGMIDKKLLTIKRVRGPNPGYPSRKPFKSRAGSD